MSLPINTGIELHEIVPAKYSTILIYTYPEELTAVAGDIGAAKKVFSIIHSSHEYHFELMSAQEKAKQLQVPFSDHVKNKR